MWFTFNQDMNVEAWTDTFRITETTGHFVIIEAESVDEANNKFKGYTGISLVLSGEELSDMGCSYDEDTHHYWKKDPYMEGKDTQTVWGYDLYMKRNEMLHGLRSSYNREEQPLKIVVYHANGFIDTIVCNAEAFEKAEEHWRDNQPSMWYVIVAARKVNPPVEVFKSDSGSYWYDKTGNIGGNLTPGKEVYTEGYSFGQFASEDKEVAAAYAAGAAEVYETMAMFAENLLKESRSPRINLGTELDKASQLGVERAIAIIMEITK